MFFRKAFGILFYSIAFAAILVVYGILFELNILKLSRVDLETDRIAAGNEVKILQISDLHSKQFGEGNRRLLKKIRGLKPDIIAITGDLVDYRTTSYEGVYSLATELVKITPEVFFVSGNHERWNDNRDDLIKELKNRGIKILNNSRTVYSKGNLSLNLCGVDFIFVNNGRRDLFYISDQEWGRVFGRLDGSRFTVLLSHSPKIAERAGQIPVDLILSGHTHGGQVRLPFKGSILTLNDPVYKKYDKGIYKLPGNKVLYIDSGAGTSILPVRFFNRCQISLITVEGIGYN